MEVASLTKRSEVRRTLAISIYIRFRFSLQGEGFNREDGLPVNLREGVRNCPLGGAYLGTVEELKNMQIVLTTSMIRI